MRRIFYVPYLAIALVLLGVLVLPKKVIEPYRILSIQFFAKPWGFLHSLRNTWVNFFHPPFEGWEREHARLEAENQILSRQLERFTLWFRDCDQYGQLKQREAELSGLSDDFHRRRKAELEKELALRQKFLPAPVIFRDPSFWGSAVWIGVGEQHNRAVGDAVVCINSPVLLGRSLVGIVERVGEESSYVRLLSDAQLSVSVRAVREGGAKELQYLAKGEVYGSSEPLWRCLQSRWKGIGFNYDFPDEEGVARDLRSYPPLIQERDLLVTSGFDGIFPAGLHVGIVTKVYPLREGACSFEIEVYPTAGDLNDLTHVQVIPPLCPITPVSPVEGR